MKHCQYLLWFAHEHVPFRLLEIESIASVLNIPIKWLESPSDKPWYLVELPNDEAVVKISERSVTMRRALHLLADEISIPILHETLKNKCMNGILEPYKSKSFKLDVDLFCNSQTQQEKVKRIESFSYLPFQGAVDLKNPEVIFQYIEYYGLDPNVVLKQPLRTFFGRVVAESGRTLIHKLSLKKRKFIGNTSMDPQLSLLMANLGKISNADLVLDPFVGSGSLLVAAAAFGGHVLGTDIDFLMLHGRTRPTRKQTRDVARKDESVRANMEQYSFIDKYIDVVIADSSTPFWHENLEFDCILTDPPYGIREPTKRIGSKDKLPIVKKESSPIHFPSKVEYGLNEIIKDLMCFSSKQLKLNGRLLFWVPVFREEYDDTQMPKHSCFKMIGNCEQVLTTFTARRLLIYEKYRKPNENDKCSCMIPTSSNFREKYFTHGDENRLTRKQKKLEAAKNKEIRLAKLKEMGVK
ncbi:tRNA (guanine(10)-N2)-methyltransferase homolog [Daktulosphaira vitifoliae]|uniref:tRNA (guanine(10)-N2)-methyltransferase homolog n=1 Tax=Daktulosphaira vitifoliae TaxID=58002 RepID=UPI0021A9F424|nr:tRNA (guanine(10)-N2)-methyltransferase homolog [Daktulosphaira vitifoliae]